MYSVSFFFFKQKTAYEMRISDWSSDVCSSDLHDCVRTAASALGLPVAVAPVDADGVIDLDALSKCLAEPGKPLLALMLANNETGVVQPVVEVEIGRASCRERVCQYV